MFKPQQIHFASFLSKNSFNKRGMWKTTNIRKRLFQNKIDFVIVSAYFYSVWFVWFYGP